MKIEELKSKNSSKQVFNFKGKYLDYLYEFQEETSVHPKLFEETYKAYVFFVYYGLVKGKKHVYDPITDASPSNLLGNGFRFSSALRAGGIYKYDTMRKMVILFDRSSEDSFDEKMDNALRFDYPVDDVDDEYLITKSKYGENSDLLEQYCYGGMDLFHSDISSIHTPEAMLEYMDGIYKEFKELLEKMR